MLSQVRTYSTSFMLLKFKDKLKVFLKKNISDGKEVTENINTRSKTSNETTLLNEIPNIISEENVIIAPRQGQTPVSILKAHSQD